MKSENPKPMPPAVSALLDDERNMPPVPKAMQEEGWRRVETALRNSAPKNGFSTAHGHRRKIARGALQSAITLGLGIALGGALHAKFAKPVEERVVTVPVPTTPPTASSDLAPMLSSSSPSMPSAAPTTTAVKSQKASAAALASSGADDLGAERTLLDRARSALASGHPADARSALEEDQRRFPHGSLNEERDFLFVECSLREGNESDAKARLERFRAQFPSSPLLRALDESVGNTNP